MKLLISWSGKQSQAVAKALREWIPAVVPGTTPWMSSLDISPGGRWFDELMRELEQTDFCVICLTPDNLRSPWLYFEAGAIAAKHQQAKVCGFVTGVSPSQLGPGPIAQFQCVESDADGVWLLVKAINDALKDKAHNEEHLKSAFTASWPRLRETLKEALLLYDPRAALSELETEQPEPKYELSKESRQLLIEGVADKNGTIIMARTMQGLHVQANGREFCEGQSARSEAKWQAAIRALLQLGLIAARGHKGEVFGVTAEGYRVADELNAVPATSV
jgi:hypothetical protein